MKPDVRGLALKIFGVDTHLAKDGNPLPRTIDFLMTNSTNPFGKDQEEFVEFMEANVAPGFLNENLVKFLITHPEVRHLLLHATLRIVPSLVTETYWSGHPYLLGPNQAMKFNVCPSPDSKFAIDDEDLKEILATHRKFESGSLGDNFENQIRQWLEPLEDISSKINANYLGIDLLNRVKRGPVKFIFSVQLEKDENSTPIENTLIEWKENDSPSIPVAELILDQQDESQDCSNLRFTPGHFIPDHRPLGNLGRGRIYTYEASQKGRNADTKEPEETVFFGN
ncbi:MAG: hypothetical protein ACXWC9_11090 [Pseudobdellovibrionaceae bacterium]